MHPLLLEAAKAACRSTKDNRVYAVGAVAIRRDGVVVRSKNGECTHRYPRMHAEARVLRKAGYGATLYVARIRKDGKLAIAKPCVYCMAAIKARGVRMVMWTVGEDTFQQEWR